MKTTSCLEQIIVNPSKKGWKVVDETQKQEKLEDEKKHCSIHNHYNRIQQQGINFNDSGAEVLRRMVHLGRLSEKLNRILDLDPLLEAQESVADFVSKYNDRSELVKLQEQLQDMREDILACWMIAEDRE